ncbi:hypothetical protein BLNAU_11280 [Blattamonas nauphoetae]|uniref:UDENN FLCN/SMCR8-type domain-containing protein n=1 Tax=Blattamonas nauphoetae TaxID=2049346 RepID=A0ABQ9XMV3_9EUKA|nr:hypothetical protein BLNAU_11280 [Blattamonas nauphoetae]
MHETDLPNDNDFFVLTEFNQQEGPIPLLVYPEENPLTSLNLNTFAIRIMTTESDSKDKSIPDFLPNDASSILIDHSERLYAFIHRFTLSDLNARGYVRPFALCYVTTSVEKILSLFGELRAECTAITRYLQSKNWVVFRADLLSHIKDIHHTYLSLTKRLSPSFSSLIHKHYRNECLQRTYRLPHIGCSINTEDIIRVYEDEFDTYGSSQMSSSLDSPRDSSDQEETNPIKIEMNRWKSKQWIGSHDLEDHTVHDVMNELVNLDIRCRQLFLSRNSTLRQRSVQTENTLQVLEAVLETVPDTTQPDATSDSDVLMDALTQVLSLEHPQDTQSECLSADDNTEPDPDDFPFSILTDYSRSFPQTKVPLKYAFDDVGVLLGLMANSLHTNTMNRPTPHHNFDRTLLSNLQSLIAPSITPRKLLLPPSTYKHIQLDKSLRNLDQIVESRENILVFFAQLRVLHNSCTVPLYFRTLESCTVHDLGGTDLPLPLKDSAFRSIRRQIRHRKTKHPSTGIAPITFPRRAGILSFGRLHYQNLYIPPPTNRSIARRIQKTVTLSLREEYGKMVSAIHPHITRTIVQEIQHQMQSVESTLTSRRGDIDSDSSQPERMVSPALSTDFVHITAQSADSPRMPLQHVPTMMAEEGSYFPTEAPFSTKLPPIMSRTLQPFSQQSSSQRTNLIISILSVPPPFRLSLLVQFRTLYSLQKDPNSFSMLLTSLFQITRDSSILFLFASNHNFTTHPTITSLPQKHQSQTVDSLLQTRDLTSFYFSSTPTSPYSTSTEDSITQTAVFNKQIELSHNAAFTRRRTHPLIQLFLTITDPDSVSSILKSYDTVGPFSLRKRTKRARPNSLKHTPSRSRKPQSESKLAQNTIVGVSINAEMPLPDLEVTTNISSLNLTDLITPLNLHRVDSFEDQSNSSDDNFESISTVFPTPFNPTVMEKPSNFPPLNQTPPTVTPDSVFRKKPQNLFANVKSARDMVFLIEDSRQSTATSRAYSMQRGMSLLNQLDDEDSTLHHTNADTPTSTRSRVSNESASQNPDTTSFAWSVVNQKLLDEDATRHPPIVINQDESHHTPSQKRSKHVSPRTELVHSPNRFDAVATPELNRMAQVFHPLDKDSRPNIPDPFPFVSPSTIPSPLPNLTHINPYTLSQHHFCQTHVQSPLSLLTSPTFSAFEFTKLFETYPAFPRCAISVLLGIPVIIYTPPSRRQEVEKIVGGLSFFVPGSEPYGRIELWRTTPFEPADLSGLAISVLSTAVTTFPTFISHRTTFWNLKKSLFIFPMYEGGVEIARMFTIPEYNELKTESDGDAESGQTPSDKAQRSTPKANPCTSLLFVNRLISSLMVISERTQLFFSKSQSSIDHRHHNIPPITSRLFRSKPDLSDSFSVITKSRSTEDTLGVQPTAYTPDIKPFLSASKLDAQALKRARAMKLLNSSEIAPILINLTNVMHQQIISGNAHPIFPLLSSSQFRYLDLTPHPS